MSDNAAGQGTITGTQSVVQPAVFGVWLETMCDGFADTIRVIVYADNEEDAAVNAILGECYGYNEDEDESIVEVNDVREAVKNEEAYTDPASITDITVQYVVPLAMFDMKMVANGQERTFKTHYPIENSDSDLPAYVINHYYQ
ncbi:hypothetical protein [uncultured Psychrobacter sp.]|uniref:hypothetical protein n=1 Tax=uncultured Psychrobacter sp. TaxID=259303 RepID=UPI0030DC9ACA